MKITTWITLVAFVLLDCSCVVHNVRMERPDDVVGPLRRGAEIQAVFTTTGETIEFDEDLPGWVAGEAVKGFQRRNVEMTVAKAEILWIAGERWKHVTSLRTRDGWAYKVTLVRSSEGDSLSFDGMTLQHVEIPLADVDALRVRRVARTGTVLTTTVGVLFACGLVVVVYLATKESCPFVYSFDGERYQFDAEPYGGATCEGLKRTEWCALEHATEIDDTYRLRLTNEVDETQYTDELKLVVVDHPEGVQVVPDVEGSFMPFAQVVPPVAAFDGSGRDIMRYVATNDWIFWESMVTDEADLADQPLREELTFQFPKPLNARTAKILFNGCNTLWGSQMVKRLLDLHGNQVKAWYNAIDTHGLIFETFREWGLREECYVLHANVKTPAGWEPRAMFVGGGPFASEDKAYLLDISDVPGDTLTLRLTPPPLFWMINFIGVDYSEGEVPVRVTELEAKEAIDEDGVDVRDLLAATDGRYLSMPTIGERADLIFDAPDRQSGPARSVFVKASGYYDIHLDAKGPPNTEPLARVATEPGYVARYALDQHLEWRSQMLASR